MKKPLSNLDEVYWKIADKYKLRKEVVENIVENQFRFVNEIIKNSDVFNLDTLKEVNIIGSSVVPSAFKIPFTVKDEAPS